MSTNLSHYFSHTTLLSVYHSRYYCSRHTQIILIYHHDLLRYVLVFRKCIERRRIQVEPTAITAALNQNHLWRYFVQLFHRVI